MGKMHAPPNVPSTPPDADLPLILLSSPRSRKDILVLALRAPHNTHLAVPRLRPPRPSGYSHSSSGVNYTRFLTAIPYG